VCITRRADVAGLHRQKSFQTFEQGFDSTYVALDGNSITDRIVYRSQSLVAAAYCSNSGPPPAYPSGPLNIVFRGSIKPSVLGNAHVFSNPAGIDCPTTCSFQFSPGKPIQLTVVADSSSFAGNIGPPCSQGGSTAPPHPGNTVMCTLLVGAVGNVIVYVDPFPLPTSPAILGIGRNPYGAARKLAANLNRHRRLA